MAGHIYYVFGLLITILMLFILTRFKKLSNIMEWYYKYNLVTGKPPIEKEFRSNEEFQLHNALSISLLLEFIWVIGGLLTNSWYVFLILFLSTILINFIKKPIEFTLIGRIISFIFILSKSVTYFYLIINHFHLHMDTWKLISNFVK
jgi:hypothetical protein